MRLIGKETAQIFVIVFVEDVELVIDKSGVFFLKDLLERAFYLITVTVVAAVLSHLVDEEQRQAFDAKLEQFTLALEVGFDSLSNLNALQMQFVGVAHEFTFADGLSVGEGDVAHRLCLIPGEDLGDGEVAVFEQFV